MNRTRLPSLLSLARRLTSTTSSYIWIVSLVSLLLLAASMYWRVPTEIAVELATSRLTFGLRGTQPVSLLNRGVTFSGLSIERCAEIDFHATDFRAESAPAQTRAIDSQSGPYSIRLSCHDPRAKVSLSGPSENPATGTSSAAAIGILDTLRLNPGRRVALEVRRTSSRGDADRPQIGPVITIELDTPQQLHLPLATEDFRVTTELVNIEPQHLGQQLPLAAYRARRHSSFQTVNVSLDERGAALIVTPIPDQTNVLFDSRARFPVESLAFVEEDDIYGGVKPSLLNWKLVYPEFSDVPAKENDDGSQFLVLTRTTNLELQILGLTPDGSALSVRIRGRLDRGIAVYADTSTVEQTAKRVGDLRLTMYETMIHGPRWTFLLIVVNWAIGVVGALSGLAAAYGWKRTKTKRAKAHRPDFE